MQYYITILQIFYPENYLNFKFECFFIMAYIWHYQIGSKSGYKSQLNQLSENNNINNIKINLIYFKIY